MSLYDDRPPFPYFGNDNNYGPPSYGPTRERNEDPSDYKPYLDKDPAPNYRSYYPRKSEERFPFYGGGRRSEDDYGGGSKNWPIGPTGPPGGEGKSRGWFPNFDWNYDDFVKKFMGNAKQDEAAPPGPEQEPQSNNIFDRYKTAFGPTNGSYSNEAPIGGPPYYNNEPGDNYDPFKEDDTYAKNCTLPYNPGESRYPTYYR